MPQIKLVNAANIKSTNGGRPKKYGEKAVQVNISLPNSVVETIKLKAESQSVADNKNISVADMIRSIVYEKVDLWDWTAANP